MKVRPFAAILTFAIAYSGTGAIANDDVARGAYLVIAGDCAGCHTDKPGGAPFAGGRSLSSPFGTVFSSNITPDKTTGIGNWTDAQFYRAMHQGVAPGWHFLYPAFPFPYFSTVTRGDTDAIRAYLKTVRPVRATPPPNQLIFPFNIRPLMWFWDRLFSPASDFRADKTKSVAWNRGAYLVNGLGHCGACHTPKNLLFGDETSKTFRGANIQDWFSANLTTTKRDGIGDWSVDDIASYLKTGGNGRATAVGTMQEVVTLSTSKMSDSDLHAIAVYLKSLAPAPAPKPPSATGVAMQDGEAAFVENCSQCHNPLYTHAPRNYPALVGNTLVQARNPQTVLRVILGGSQSASVPHASIAFSMPAFATLSDRQVADVATYIRNSWGNKATPVTPSQVREARTSAMAMNE